MPVSERHLDDPAEIGPYRVLARLGEGGMGVVYLVDSGAGRRALKLLRPEAAGDPEFRARFRREVTAVRRVSGEATARLLDAEVDGPRPYLVTEYVSGPSLKEAVEKDGPLSHEAATGLAAALANALTSIHAAQVVHRDLKPGNVILAAGGPRIIDFGISWASESTKITRTSLGIGSPAWMSPEAALGQVTGAPADVFSWGAVVAYAATGRPPFGGGQAHAVLYRVVAEEPDLAGLAEPLVSVVRMAMAKDPAVRPGAADLVRMLAGAGGRRRPRIAPGALAAGAAGLLVLGAVLGVVLASRGGGTSRTQGTSSTPTTPTTPTVQPTTASPGPQLYVSTGATRGALFAWPSFPTSIQVDNYDAVNGLRWTELGTTVTGTGSYDYDRCTPDCSALDYVIVPVTIVLSDPVECTVSLDDPSTGQTTTQRVVVYASLTSSVTGSGAPAQVVGLKAPTC